MGAALRARGRNAQRRRREACSTQLQQGRARGGQTEGRAYVGARAGGRAPDAPRGAGPPGPQAAEPIRARSCRKRGRRAGRSWSPAKQGGAARVRCCAGGPRQAVAATRCQRARDALPAGPGRQRACDALPAYTMLCRRPARPAGLRRLDRPASPGPPACGGWTARPARELRLRRLDRPAVGLRRLDRPPGPPVAPACGGWTARPARRARLRRLDRPAVGRRRLHRPPGPPGPPACGGWTARPRPGRPACGGGTARLRAAAGGEHSYVLKRRRPPRAQPACPPRPPPRKAPRPPGGAAPRRGRRSPPDPRP